MCRSLSRCGAGRFGRLRRRRAGSSDPRNSQKRQARGRAIGRDFCETSQLKRGNPKTCPSKYHSDLLILLDIFRTPQQRPQTLPGLGAQTTLESHFRVLGTRHQDPFMGTDTG